MQTSVGYIGADAFTRKLQGRRRWPRSSLIHRNVNGQG
jgi:hypothetical protein